MFGPCAIVWHPLILFLLIREQKHMHYWGKGRGRKRILSIQAPSLDLGIMAWASVNSRTFNLLSHPGAPNNFLRNRFLPIYKWLMVPSFFGHWNLLKTFLEEMLNQALLWRLDLHVFLKSPQRFWCRWNPLVGIFIPSPLLEIHLCDTLSWVGINLKEIKENCN